MLFRREADGGVSRDGILASLVPAVGLYIYHIFAVLVDVFSGDLAAEPDDVREIDELAVLGVVLLEPALVAHPVAEEGHQPGLSLSAYIVGIGQACGFGGPFVPVHCSNRLPGIGIRVAEGP